MRGHIHAPHAPDRPHRGMPSRRDLRHRSAPLIGGGQGRRGADLAMDAANVLLLLGTLGLAALVLAAVGAGR